MPGLELEVVVADPRPVLHLLQVDDVLLLLCRTCRLGLFEPVLPIIHHLHNRWPGGGSHFDEIKTSLSCGSLRLVDRYDPDLFSISTDQPDRTDTDLFVYPDALLLFVVAYVPNGQ